MSRRAILVLVSSFAVAACVSVPERNVPPDVSAALPERFTDVAPMPDGKLDSRWWRAFGDPALDALVERGLSRNADLAIGAARLLEARAIARQSGSSRFPQIGLFTNGTRQRSASPAAPIDTGTMISEGGTAGVSVSYEADLWGRLQAQTAAARQTYLSEGYTLAALRLTVAAELVRGYLQVQALEAQRAILEENVSLLEQAVRLNERRFALGNIAELDVERVRAELEDSRAQLAETVRSAATTRRALLVLAGEVPTAQQSTTLTVRKLEQAQSDPLPEVPLGLPSDLLTRRPDLRAAEARLAAARADVAAARRALLPSLSLTASSGEASGSLSNLFGERLDVWSLGAELFVTVFDAGRRRAGIHAADARRVQTLELYRDTVRGAFREVLDALDARTAARETHRARTEQVGALERSLTLAQRRYDEGYSSYLEVLDARRGLLQARLAAVQARNAAGTAYVDLALAVGGGWDPDENMLAH